eukprot:1001702-Alexandrium_andersonii.AAC.1
MQVLPTHVFALAPSTPEAGPPLDDQPGRKPSKPEHKGHGPSIRGGVPPHLHPLGLEARTLPPQVHEGLRTSAAPHAGVTRPISSDMPHGTA